jgi:phenylpropionate dioxygenase-like ring-hydroxylating dioxygenase large terminal subunit
MRPLEDPVVRNDWHVAARAADVADLLVSQDVRVVESQRPELRPLDLAEELLLRSDRTAIAYRQFIKARGVRFGRR